MGVAAAAVALAIGGATPAEAQQKTIRVGNWLPMHHLIVKGIVEPWARAIEAETGGELKFEVMTSALGPPPATFDLLLDGAIDVGYGVSGHNPGRFTMTQVMDLPFASRETVRVRCLGSPSWQLYVRLVFDPATKALPRVVPTSHSGAVVSDMTPNYLCAPKALRNLAGSVGAPAHWRLLLLMRHEWFSEYRRPCVLSKQRLDPERRLNDCICDYHYRCR
jgi:hypothetical protein